MVYPPKMVTDPSINPAVHGSELNSQPVDYLSNAVTTTLPNNPKFSRVWQVYKEDYYCCYRVGQKNCTRCLW